MEPDEWKSLVSAQKALVNYRALQIASIEATYSRMEGTMWRPVSGSRVMEITKERALFLEALLEISPKDKFAAIGAEGLRIESAKLANP